MNEKKIYEICDYILNNLDEIVNLNDIEKVFNYNKYYLIRTFKLYTGYTIMDYINYAKVYKSIDLILNTDNSILYVALNSGFNSQEYYSEKFKNIIGLPPKRLKKLSDSLKNNIDEIEKNEILRIINEINENKNIFYSLHFNLLNKK